ncbi:hypothetical protein QZN20_10020 [Burkholderia multivorans]|nr:hypothetical protein [Burkholderia multivorans]
MKITDDMLTEMEPIVSQWIRERGTCMDGASYAAALELAAYVAASRTTPDRESIIEECAKVCDDHAKTSYLTEAATCARKIRALKTAPTSDKGGA